MFVIVRLWERFILVGIVDKLVFRVAPLGEAVIFVGIASSSSFNDKNKLTGPKVPRQPDSTLFRAAGVYSGARSSDHWRSPSGSI
jgi:hypothetical protein